MVEQQMKSQVAAIRFQPLGKLYYFDCSQMTDLAEGDFVIVSTSRGRELGQVVSFIETEDDACEDSWKPIERRATPRDMVMSRLWWMKEEEALDTCQAQVEELKLKGLKIAKAEFSFDGSRLTFLYSNEGEEKPDLKALRRAMQRKYRSSRVEIRQIGPRDVAKAMAGMGACGMEVRCCCRFLTEFTPISIKMAKAQGISLNPQEITGMCGRLRCCLRYEYDTYLEARKELPKRNSRVKTPVGEGKVADVLPLKNAIIVMMGDGRRIEFPSDDVEYTTQEKST